MKRVYCPKLEKVIVIDSKKEKTWKKKYWHHSGVPFQASAKETAKDDLLAKMPLESLQIMYEDKMEKRLPARYKNDKEWIISKL